MLTVEKALEAWKKMYSEIDGENHLFVGTINPEMVKIAINAIEETAKRKEVVCCKACKFWEDVTISTGKCHCEEMWESLYGCTDEIESIDMDKDFFCGFAVKREDYEEDC